MIWIDTKDDCDGNLLHIATDDVTKGNLLIIAMFDFGSQEMYDKSIDEYNWGNDDNTIKSFGEEGWELAPQWLQECFGCTVE